MGIIFLGLVVAYNPAYSYYLMSHGALGGMSIRVATGGLFLLFAGAYLAAGIQKRKSLPVKTSPIFSVVTLLFGIYLAAIVAGLLKGNPYTFWVLDTFPLLEMFCAYYFIRFLPDLRINPGTILKWLSVYLLVMCVSDLLTYGFLSFVKKIGFGALRANISGITVNRLMDFMVPILGAGLMMLSGQIKNRPLRWILPACILFTVALAFYRTVYVAFFAAVIFLMVLKKKNTVILVKTTMLALALGFVVFAVVQQSRSGDGAIGMARLISQRVQSTFDSRKKDYAINSRFEQMARAVRELPNVPVIGHGMGGHIDGQALHVTSNYFLQLFLLLGIPGGILFVWLYYKVTAVLVRLSRSAPDLATSSFYLAVSSALAALAVVLCFFPYTIYFPLLYTFGAIAGMADRVYSDSKTLVAAAPREDK